MPMPVDGAVWGALLGACMIHKNVGMGEEAFERVINFEPTNGYYVLMVNIYTDTGQIDGVAKAKRIYELVVKLERMVKEKTGGGGVVEKNGDTTTAAGTAVSFVGFHWWTRRKWSSRC
uniref:Pentatricopeptide repeat-containing protein n=1 Tax=Oryza brachyantha TaxID=4533 RepID=J3LQ42_ORYBR